MRVLLAPALLLMTLSGCVADGNEPVADAASVDPMAAEPEAIALPDTNFEERYELLQALPETTFAFDVAEGATGSVLVAVEPQDGPLLLYEGPVCAQWERLFPGGYARGSTGNCNDGGNGLTLSFGMPATERHVLLDWSELPAGAYKIKVRADAQPNELVVGIFVDNP